MDGDNRQMKADYTRLRPRCSPFGDGDNRQMKADYTEGGSAYDSRRMETTAK